ncbi:MAG: nucleoside triphosphate pyrophosphohydrolase, partial [Deltaproteobacteria bacterium]|nr:nucleoside triphosphate pyrophosphohydrolase [Deltaproteobacteria bacterium]
PPRGPSPDAGAAFARLERLLDGLLDPERGCPWDLKQTARSVSEDLLEEVYELREALLDGDPAHVREEAGDLFFLVVFLGRLAARDPSFGFGAREIIDSAVDKMVYRHPHVFAPAPADAQEAPAPGVSPAVPAAERCAAPAPGTAEEVLDQWHAMKRAQRRTQGLLASVPADLPALARCHRLGAKAGRAGFDWDGPGQVRTKLDEEIDELDRELSLGDWRDPAHAERIASELGDCLAALANLSRHLGISAEKALQAHNRRFSERVAWMEGALASRGRRLEEASAVELDALWREAKKRA